MILYLESHQPIQSHLIDSHYHLSTSQIMETLLRVLHSNSAGVSEEAMRTVGAFTYGLGRNFMKYMPQFYPYLKMGLTNYQEWEVSWMVSVEGVFCCGCGCRLSAYLRCVIDDVDATCVQARQCTVH